MEERNQEKQRKERGKGQKVIACHRLIAQTLTFALFSELIRTFLAALVEEGGEGAKFASIVSKLYLP